jgi:lysophospholipase L1-like esterase
MKIYVVGDSISIQYGPYLRQYLAGVMEYARKEGDAEALLNLDNPQGANGGDSAMVLGFLKALARSGSLNADLLLVNCGLHDIKRNPATGQAQVGIADYESNLRALVVVAREMRTELVWIRTTPCDEKVHNRPGLNFQRFSADCAVYNAVADRVMNEAGVPSIDLHTFTCNLGPDLYCDHVHFHDAIREKQGAFIAGWLNGWKSAKRPARDQ